MPPPLRLLGKVFERLTVIEKTDRRDNTGNVFWKCNGPYSLENCKWLRFDLQARNRRDTVYV